MSSAVVNRPWSKAQCIPGRSYDSDRLNISVVERLSLPAARSSSAGLSSGARCQRGGGMGAAERVGHHVGSHHPAAHSGSVGQSQQRPSPAGRALCRCGP